MRGSKPNMNAVPPKWMINLMGSTGILLIVEALPVGFFMLFYICFKEHVEARFEIIPIAEMTISILVTGVIFYWLCHYFSKKARLAVKSKDLLKLPK